ncbi:hypothetical protein F2P56_014050 [Juglans regia]|uniref:RNase H type-1 domain-containing protein n=2 Tax=Juglans regia TaxID=51240 RepID=A0A833XC62_JUGRE|nr:uncharacterized protein LOC108995289 [Juglans regia]KAF5463927.1 hypothetical protein F2P56_014050 [Juglans regia]
MPGIDIAVIEQCLNVDPKAKKIKQKRRSFSAEKYAAIVEEIDQLLAAGFIREVHYPEWLSNVVLVKKHLTDLREAFAVLRKYKIKLNLQKCAFGVKSGKFLGFMVSEHGIEADPKKVNAIMDMLPPRTINEIQRLAGKVAALNHFIVRSTNHCLPFFRVLKKAQEWDDECSWAFSELKEYFAYPPLLSHIELREDLTIYLAMTPNVMSTVLGCTSSLGEEHNYAIKLGFKTTNNKAEYEALLARMIVARSLGATEVEVRANSQVVVSQVTGQFAIKGEKLKKYLQ